MAKSKLFRGLVILAALVAGLTSVIVASSWNEYDTGWHTTDLNDGEVIWAQFVTIFWRDHTADDVELDKSSQWVDFVDGENAEEDFTIHNRVYNESEPAFFTDNDNIDNLEKGKVANSIWDYNGAGYITATKASDQVFVDTTSRRGSPNNLTQLVIFYSDGGSEDICLEESWGTAQEPLGQTVANCP